MKEKIVRFVAWLVRYKFPNAKNNIHYVVKEPDGMIRIRASHIVSTYVSESYYKSIIAKDLADALIKDETVINMVITAIENDPTVLRITGEILVVPPLQTFEKI